MTLDYKAAGVDKEAGYKEVALIKNIVKKTFHDKVITDLGGFSGMVALGKDMEEPVLVSGTDGVGTKLMIAQDLDIHNTIGIDLVAMCVNDIICQGARPLFFLDYIATGKLVPEKMAEIVEGVAEGCIQSGAALVGGETAEMPGMYEEDTYDLAGFAVGVVDKKNIINGKNIEEGDIAIGLPSTGVHSNGFSLVRAILDKKGIDFKDSYKDTTIGQALLEPTKIYAKEVLALIDEIEVRGLAHITGGGLYENLPRVLPEGLGIEVEEANIPSLDIFDFLMEEGNIAKEEMYNTFNMGVGMVAIIKEADKEKALEILKDEGCGGFYLGKITGEEGVSFA